MCSHIVRAFGCLAQSPSIGARGKGPPLPSRILPSSGSYSVGLTDDVDNRRHFVFRFIFIRIYKRDGEIKILSFYLFGAAVTQWVEMDV